MAYDEYLEERINLILHRKKVNFHSKKMMGGLCYMVDDKMCLGIVKGQIMARIGEAAYDIALSKNGCSEMNFTGRPMRGFVFISEEGFDMDEDLEYWIQLCLDYNPLAQKSKKRKSKKLKH